MNERENTVNALSRVFALIFGVCCTLGVGIVGGWIMRQCTYDMQPLDTLSVRTDTVRDTIVEIRRDTVPKVVTEKVTDYVAIQVPHIVRDTVRDSVNVELPVVQKVYHKDSLYTAWVSGIACQDLPRLDSVSVVGQTVTQYVTKTVTVMKPPNRFVVAVTAGAGIDPTTGKISPCIAVGAGYLLWQGGRRK